MDEDIISMTLNAPRHDSGVQAILESDWSPRPVIITISLGVLKTLDVTEVARKEGL